MEKVLLKIRTQQTSKDGQKDDMDLLTKARTYKKNKSLYYLYEETELSGITGCVTSLKIEEDSVLLKRFGLTPAQELQFITGRKFTGKYDTPLGSVDMEVITNKIINELKADGTSGKLTIDYNISLRGLIEAHNTLEIKAAPLSE